MCGRIYISIMSSNPKSDTRRIGYARVSTEEQDLSLQLMALKEAGVDHIVTEKASGGRMDRAELEKCKQGMRAGDTLVVWKLDRLGRSAKGILELIDWLNANDIGLQILTENLDTRSASGRMVATVIAALAQMERDLTSERTRTGIQAKKAAGHVFGRRHSIKDNPKRIAAFAPYIENGEAMTMNPKEALRILNAADPRGRKITSPETFRRWRREGFPGYQSPNELTGK